MPTLVHLNGPPGVGKSTIARGLAARRQLALPVDIDTLRTSMTGWAEHSESKLLARQVGFAMATTHLANGHDVVLAQLLVAPEWIERVSALWPDHVEVVLTAPVDELIERLRSCEHPQPHPRSAFSLDKLAEQIIWTLRSIEERVGALVVDVGGLDGGAALDAVAAAIGW